MSDPRKISEKAFQAHVIRAAKLNGWMVAHFRPGMTKRGRWVTPVQGDGAGFPDLVLVKDRVLFVELKVGKGVLSNNQKKWARALGMANASVDVWRPDNMDEIWLVLQGWAR